MILHPTEKPECHNHTFLKLVLYNVQQIGAFAAHKHVNSYLNEYNYHILKKLSTIHYIENNDDK
jgi:hypothetical protein